MLYMCIYIYREREREPRLLRPVRGQGEVPALRLPKLRICVFKGKQFKFRNLPCQTNYLEIDTFSLRIRNRNVLDKFSLRIAYLEIVLVRSKANSNSRVVCENTCNYYVDKKIEVAFDFESNFPFNMQ